MKRLSLYTGRTVPKFKPRERAFKQFKSPALNVLIFGTLRLLMITNNLFVIANVKQLRTR